MWVRWIVFGEGGGIHRDKVGNIYKHEPLNENHLKKITMNMFIAWEKNHSTNPRTSVSIPMKKKKWAIHPWRRRREREIGDDCGLGRMRRKE